MSETDGRSFLQSQILDVMRLIEMAGDDPLMAPALKERQAELEKQLAEAPVMPRVPRTVLFFAGEPTFGSYGVDAEFASEVLGRFVEMVKTQHAAEHHGGVGRRGPRRGEAEAKLLLTGTPRGSFGLELSKPGLDDFVVANQLSQTLISLTDLVKSTAENDESFAMSVARVSPRVVDRLREFFDILDKHKASLKMVSGELQAQLDRETVARAKERVSSAQTQERQVEKSGVFRGATLDTWRFDFRTDEHVEISGRLSEELSEDQVVQMLRHANEHCIGVFREITVITRSGVKRAGYELLELKPPPQIA
jgi:hypothetical protein